MKIFICGNGNISVRDFVELYATTIDNALESTPDAHFIICEFRGTDVLCSEYLKTKTANVSVFHVGERPRYKPDAFKTFVDKWLFVGGYKSDLERDMDCIEQCTHFIAYDFNSDAKRKSGTKKNIDMCIAKGKIQLFTV